MNNENFFDFINENGETIKCEILFTFDSNETNKSYRVFTDNTEDEDGNTRVFAMYEPKEGDTKMQLVTDEKELKTVENVLKSIQETLKAEMEDGEQE